MKIIGKSLSITLILGCITFEACRRRPHPIYHHDGLVVNYCCTTLIVSLYFRFSDFTLSSFSPVILCRHCRCSAALSTICFTDADAVPTEHHACTSTFTCTCHAIRALCPACTQDFRPFHGYRTIPGTWLKKGSRVPARDVATSYRRFRAASSFLLSCCRCASSAPAARAQERDVAG